MIAVTKIVVYKLQENILFNLSESIFLASDILVTSLTF